MAEKRFLPRLAVAFSVTGLVVFLVGLIVGS